MNMADFLHDYTQRCNNTMVPLSSAQVAHQMEPFRSAKDDKWKKTRYSVSMEIIQVALSWTLYE